MPQLLPPPPPPVTVGGDDNRERMQFRLWQILMATLTIMVALWFTTFGVVPAILAWVIAKHVLVAILMMGLHRYPRDKDEGQAPLA